MLVFGRQTDKAIRHQLAQPRQQLTLSVGMANGQDYVLLQSPAAGFTVDANNGPTTLVHNVLPYGTETFMVTFSVQTDVNEAGQFAKNPSPLLSHQWSMAHDIDLDYFATRTIQGHAIFRTDFMVKNGFKPDDYRSWLFHPVPTNFKRENVRVWVSEDGTEAEYIITDREKASTILIQNVTRLEVIYTQGISSIGVEEAATNIVAAGLQFTAASGEVTAATAAEAAATALGQPGTGANAVVQAVENQRKAAFAIGAAARGAIPQLSRNMLVRVWGNRLATRAGLRNVAYSVVKTKISLLTALVGGTDFQITEDLMNRFVQVSGSFRAGPLQSAFELGTDIGRAGIDALAGKPVSFPIFDVGPDSIDGIANANDTAPVIGSYLPQADSGARGSYVASIVAQALTNTGDPRVKPTNPPASTSRTP